MRFSLFVITLLFIAVSASADVPDMSHVEFFGSLDYCNTDSTTAFWDTSDTSLRLHPYAITNEATFNTAGFAYHLVVDGDRAYVADGKAGLQILDITDPTALVLLGTLDTVGTVMGVALRGQYAYLADGDHGLQVVDVSDPTTPLLAGGVDTPGSAYDVAVGGHYAYVADRSGGLQIVDVGNPYVPTIVGSVATADNAYGVAYYGGFCYVAASSAGVHSVNVADPAAPFISSTQFLSGYAWDVVVTGGYGYVACDAAGLAVCDLSSASTLGYFATAGPALDVAIDGRYAYVSESDGGLEVVDVADPSAPALKNAFNTAGNAWAAWPAGEYCFVADGSAGLHSLHVRDAIDATEIGLYTHYFREVKVQGSIVYGVGSTRELEMVDVSDPTAPQSIIEFAGSAMDLEVQGHRIYVAAQTAGLKIYVSYSSHSAQFASQYPTTNSYTAVSVDRHLLAAANGADGVDLIDVSSTYSPALITTIDPPEVVLDVLLDGDVLYVGTEGALYAYEVSDPASPVFLDNYVSGGGSSFSELLLHGHVLYAIGATVTNSWIVYFDASDPTDIVYEDSRAVGGEDAFHDLCITGDLLVAGGSEGVYGFSLANPLDPTLIWSDTDYYANSVVITGDYQIRCSGSNMRLCCGWERTLDYSGAVAVSLPVIETDYEIVAARIYPYYTGPNTTAYYLSADGGDYDRFYRSGSTFKYFDRPGGQLQWRVEFPEGVSEIDGDPRVTSLSVIWVYERPFIDTITDVANDQGRQVSLSWAASGYDLWNSPTPVTEYAIYRRIDPDLKAGIPADKITGDYHFLMTVPALCDDEYHVVVPTLADSTVADGLYESIFKVVALTDTPSVYFESLPDTGYSVDNLAPSAPAGLKLEGAMLSWNEATEADFDYFKVYGCDSSTPDGGEVLVAQLTGTARDMSGDIHEYYFVTAVDFSGNEGDVAITGGLAAVPEALPDRYALHAATPNPFNPQTVIAFDLPQAKAVRLEIFDLTGARVRTLLAGEVLDAGRREALWRGRDDAGRPLAAGVYIYRLEAGDFSDTRRMTLVK